MSTVEKRYSMNRKLSLDEVLAALVSSHIVSEEQGVFIKKKKGLSRRHPLVSVYECDLPDRRFENKKISLDDLTKWLAKYSGYKYFSIDPLKIDIEVVTAVLPKAYVKRLEILPIQVSEESVTFATAEPFATSWIDEVTRIIRKKVEIVVSNPLSINSSIEDFYTVRKAVSKIMRERKKYNSNDIEKMLSTNSLSIASKDEKGISGIADWLLHYAWEERASDIHLEPKSGIGVVRFRIDGTLRVVYKFDSEIMLSVLSRFKILSGMKVDEKRRPQDGRIKRVIEEDRIIEIRSSTIPTHYGEKLVMRIFDPKMADKNLEEIGFDEEDLKTWKEVSEGSNGIVLVTGPTGSGKSTTLHATLKHLSRPEVNICTVEDPIEIINDEFSQMQVNKTIDLDFSQAIKYFLRQDPDIIMVGEIRDTETSHMAIQASLTGHMVLSTLHTNDALSSVTRMLDLGVQAHLLNATVKALMAQRLVRVLCHSCKKKVTPNKSWWESLIRPFSMEIPSFVYERKGCGDCKGSGYHGRINVYELIVLNDKIRSVIKEGVEVSDLYKAAQGSFLPLRLHAASKVAEGVTSIEEVLRVII